MSLGAMSGLMGNPYRHDPKLEIKTDANGKWRWHISVSSDIVAASSQGYATKELAKENLLKLEQHIKYLREKNLI